MGRPRLLDLFSGAGGASMGYHRAGFEVVGVDLDPRPLRHYPFESHNDGALHFLEAHGHEFDVIHASPPCQRFSKLAGLPHRREMMQKYPDLIEPVRALLKASGKPYIIENVPGAPLENYIMLCGSMFPELRVIRHRWFETNFPVPQPSHDNHPYGGVGLRHRVWKSTPGDWVTVAGHLFSKEAGSVAMGIHWMTRPELAESIPPAYTEFIGRYAREAIR